MAHSVAYEAVLRALRIFQNDDDVDKIMQVMKPPLLIFLIDVSGSMQSAMNIKCTTLQNDGQASKLQSAIRGIQNISARAVPGSFRMVVHVFGLHPNVPQNTCDLIQLVQRYGQQARDPVVDRRDDLCDLLARNGAQHCRSYVMDHLPPKHSQLVVDFYSQPVNAQKLRDFVDGLPEVCKTDPAFIPLIPAGVQRFSLFGYLSDATATISRIVVPEITVQRNAEIHWSRAREDVFASLRASNGPSIVPMAEPRAHDVQSFSAAVGNLQGVENLELALAPYVFGATPMRAAMTQVQNVLLVRESRETTKVVVLVSDGESTDGNPENIAGTYKANGVVVVGCFLSSDRNVSTRELFGAPDPTWSGPARSMFNMSSEISTLHPAVMALHVNQKWKVPDSGVCRLFFLGNHDDLVKDAADLAQQLTEGNEDVIPGLLGSIGHCLQIGRDREAMEAPEQTGGTCYANAVASAICLANKRVIGRVSAPFCTVREQLIVQYGTDGAISADVLRSECPKHRLQFQEVDEAHARRALNAGRVLVARYQLYHDQWETFTRFFRNNKTGILTSVGGTNGVKLGGHAVLLFMHGRDYLMCMNKILLITGSSAYVMRQSSE